MKIASAYLHTVTSLMTHERLELRNLMMSKSIQDAVTDNASKEFFK